jgi:hypothetical protein
MKFPSALNVGLCLIVTCAFCKAAKRKDARPTTQAAYDEYQTAIDKAEDRFTEATLEAEHKYLNALDTAFKAAMKDADLDSANQISAAKKEIEAKISETDSAMPRTVDLLPFIDVHRDAISGNWRTDDGELFSDAQKTRIEIPYEPPAEYDFVINFTRLQGNQSIAQICSHGRTQFLCALAWGDGNTFAGIGMISGLGPENNSLGTKMNLENGREHVAIVQVRTDEIQFYLDGKLISHHETDFKDMGLPENRGLYDSVALGLDTWESPTVFHKVQLIEISGHGHEIK